MHDGDSHVKIRKAQRKHWICRGTRRFKQKKIKKKNWSTTYKEKAQERDRRMKQWAGRISNSPASCSETLWNTHIGWWLVNSLRKSYTQMHPSCRMNYSSPTVCTFFFWKKQLQDFKAGLKDLWMSIWIKIGKMNYTKQPLDMGMKDNKEKEQPWVQKSKVIYYFLTHDWCNTDRRRTERSVYTH